MHKLEPLVAATLCRECPSSPSCALHSRAKFEQDTRAYTGTSSLCIKAQVSAPYRWLELVRPLPASLRRQLPDSTPFEGRGSHHPVSIAAVRLCARNKGWRRQRLESSTGCARRNRPWWLEERQPWSGSIRPTRNGSTHTLAPCNPGGRHNIVALAAYSCSSKSAPPSNSMSSGCGSENSLRSSGPYSHSSSHSTGTHRPVDTGYRRRPYSRASYLAPQHAGSHPHTPPAALAPAGR